MVRPIESFHAERDFLSLFYVEILKETQIMVLEARAVQEVAHPVRVEFTGGRCGEDCRAVGVLSQEPELLIRRAVGERPITSG